MSLKTALEDHIQGLALEGVDIIFISKRYLFDRLVGIKIPKVIKPIQLIHVEDLNDLKAMSHEDMKKMGWVRVEKKVRKKVVKEQPAEKKKRIPRPKK